MGSFIVFTRSLFWLIQQLWKSLNAILTRKNLPEQGYLLNCISKGIASMLYPLL